MLIINLCPKTESSQNEIHIQRLQKHFTISRYLRKQNQNQLRKRKNPKEKSLPSWRHTNRACALPTKPRHVVSPIRRQLQLCNLIHCHSGIRFFPTILQHGGVGSGPAWFIDICCFDLLCSRRRPWEFNAAFCRQSAGFRQRFRSEIEPSKPRG